jgi:ketosteroid isomerase-like protein
MSQENVETVKAAFEAWNAGDMDAVRELYDADVFMRMPEGWPEPGPFVGRDAVMRQWDQQRETWDSDALIPVSDFIDAADRVVVRFIWRGAGYGPEPDLEMTNVFMVRKGRVVYQEFFWNHAEALETLGLSEERMPQENVEVVQRLIEAFNRRDDDWRSVLAELDSDIEVHDLDISLDAEHFRGHHEVRKWLGVWSDAWGSWRIEDVDVRPVGEDRAIGMFLMICKGKGSGIELARRDALVCTLRTGKIAEMTYYNEQQLPQALEAVGLSE